MRQEGRTRRDAYARLLEQLLPEKVTEVRSARALLRAAAVDAEAEQLDGHLRQTALFVGAVERALTRLDRSAWLMLQAAAGRSKLAPPSETDVGRLRDAVGGWLLETLRRWPSAGLDLALATGRLLEESRAIDPRARRTTPLGRGFESRLNERLRLRLETMRRDPGLVQALEAHRLLLLEAPRLGREQIADAIGRPLSGEERRWIEAERFAGMLEIARTHSRKTEAGHIRWYVRRDPLEGPVLDRYGAHGHWLVTGAERDALARVGTLAARATDELRIQQPTTWRALTYGDLSGQESTATTATLPLDEAYTLPTPPDGLTEHSVSSVRRDLERADTRVAQSLLAAAATVHDTRSSGGRRYYSLHPADGTLLLTSMGGVPDHQPLAQVALDPDDDALLDFLDVLGRVRDVATIIDRIGPDQGDHDAVRWARGLLAQSVPQRDQQRPEDLADLRVRLVYVPASQPHPLGGLPLIGLRYVADQLERLGVQTDVLSIAPRDLRRRRVELLGADVIGISVYLTNRVEVARLIRLLRAAGYAGRIVLGGPELREIDLVARTVTGWDALVRGEGEEAFPQVMRVLRHFEAGDVGRALSLARTLHGVAIAHGNLTVLADTAARNAVERMVCPLPFEWRRYSQAHTLKMNFTRGCPYKCSFCPNHQGQRFHSCTPEAMWTFTEQAAADALVLPRRVAERRALLIQEELRIVARPRLRVALNLLLRQPVPRELLESIGISDELSSSGPTASGWEVKRALLADKAALLTTARLVSEPVEDADATQPQLRPFELMTSEDNTLVNRQVITEYMRLRRANKGSSMVIFNPGQNTVRDLTDHYGGTDTAYIDLLSADNPFKVVLGVDGTSNPVLRANNKPQYSIADAVALNRSLNQRGIDVLNNYILLSPETDLLEAVEAFVLFLLLPIRWRDHGPSVNLRIVTEPGTRSCDEGILFAPRGRGYDDPMRFPAVEALLRRWRLTSSVHSADLPTLLWRILFEDDQVRQQLPQVVRRWERDFDDDPFLRALAMHVRALQQPGKQLAESLSEVADSLRLAWPRELPAPTAASSAIAGSPALAGERCPRAGSERGPTPLPHAASPATTASTRSRS